MTNEQKLLDRAEAIQKECHRTVEYVKANAKNFNYQDATNVFIFRKLAELELLHSDKNADECDANGLHQGTGTMANNQKI